MGMRTKLARGVGLAVSQGMRLMRRGATTLPGRIALDVDPALIAGLAGKLRQGSIVVCGTNGKTTTNNILARAVQEGGSSVLCNWAGANMESGVATALLPGSSADWGVFENDELSTVRIVPSLRPRFLVLLNLFRDQLDRCGELDRVQDVIVSALEGSPETTLLYNGDDPLCEGVAMRARAAGVATRAFGIAENLHLGADRVVECGFCQSCGAPLRYAYRQYGQLGDYTCPNCDFSRPELDYYASDVTVGEDGVSFVAHVPGSAPVCLEASWGGTYMVYNLLAAFAAAGEAGVGAEAFQRVLDTYHPENGRLQRFDVEGRKVTLNLAKNPTGFNQNMSLLLADPAPKAVYVIINDNYNDGKDVSWLWDVDFERMAQASPRRVFVGGHRANDMQVRLKYAGLEAPIAQGVGEVLDAIGDLPADCRLYVLTNYSALWPAKAELERIGEAL